MNIIKTEYLAKAGVEYLLHTSSHHAGLRWTNNRDKALRFPSIAALLEGVQKSAVGFNYSIVTELQIVKLVTREVVTTEAVEEVVS